MCQQVDLVLLRLVDMSFNGMFSNHHCLYTGPTGEQALLRLLMLITVHLPLVTVYPDPSVHGQEQITLFPSVNATEWCCMFPYP